jgi:hypothetical protein
LNGGVWGLLARAADPESRMPNNGPMVEFPTCAGKFPVRIKTFPVPQNKFPVTLHREFRHNPLKPPDIRTPNLPKRALFREIPCSFP